MSKCVFECWPVASINEMLKSYSWSCMISNYFPESSLKFRRLPYSFPSPVSLLFILYGLSTTYGFLWHFLRFANSIKVAERTKCRTTPATRTVYTLRKSNRHRNNQSSPALFMTFNWSFTLYDYCMYSFSFIALHKLHWTSWS